MGQGVKSLKWEKDDLWNIFLDVVFFSSALVWDNFKGSSTLRVLLKPAVRGIVFTPVHVPWRYMKSHHRWRYHYNTLKIYKWMELDGLDPTHRNKSQDSKHMRSNPAPFRYAPLTVFSELGLFSGPVHILRRSVCDKAYQTLPRLRFDPKRRHQMVLSWPGLVFQKPLSRNDWTWMTFIKTKSTHWTPSCSKRLNGEVMSRSSYTNSKSLSKTQDTIGA